MEPASALECPARPQTPAGRGVALGAAVALAAASTTTAVPSLRALVDAHGLGAGAGAMFVVAHVLGQVVGAAALGRRLRGGALRARGLVVGGLAISAALSAMMAAIPALGGGFAALVVLRLADGGAHVAAIMGLLGAGAAAGATSAATSGAPDDPARERRLRILGGVLVVGVAAGLGVGTGLVGQAIAAPFAASAAFAAIAAAIAALVVPREVARAARAGGPSAAPRPTVLAVAAERFAFGVLTVALPLAAAGAVEARWTGASLGTMMLGSVAALPLVAAAARRVGWGAVGLASAIVLAGAMALLAAPGTVTSAIGIPWAIAGGIAAAGIYAAALAAVAAIADAAARARAVGVVHAAGSAGHAAGALLAGVAISGEGLALPPLDAAAILGAVAVGVAGVVLAALRSRA